MNLPSTLPAFNFSAIACIKEITKHLLLGGIYFVACIAAFWVGTNLETVPESSAIFIPAGIKIAFYLLSPTRYWVTLWLSSRALAAHFGYLGSGVWEFNLLQGVNFDQAA